MDKILAELLERQRTLKTEGEGLLDLADKESRDLTGDEETRYTAIETELTQVADEITARQKAIDRRQNLAAIRSVPAVPAGEGVTDEPDPVAQGGFHDIAEFAVAVRAASTGGVADPRLNIGAAPTGFHDGGGSAGEGYMLPTRFRDEIWELVIGQEGIFNTVDLEPTNQRQVPFVKDETTPWGSSGIQANWRAEGSKMDGSKLATSGGSMPLHELYAFVLATEELLEDAPRLASRISRKSAEAINWKIDESVINGNGSGQPLGWMNSNALITVAKQSGQSADTINSQNVLKMYSRLLKAPGDAPYWLANLDTVPQLAEITVGDKPVWMPPNGLMSAPGGMLLGYPVRFSEHAETLGDLGDLQLVSPKGYYAARRAQGPKFAQSMHLFFDHNMQAFRWTFRFGGQPHLSKPIEKAKGGGTKSHFVTLGERT